MPERTPFPHQTEGIDFLTSGTYYAAQMGCGKTSVAIWKILQRGDECVLVVGPAIALGVWEREIRLLEPDATIQTVRRAADTKRLAKWYLVSYDLISRNPQVCAALNAMYFDAMIDDEAHRMKTPTANRSGRILLRPDALIKRVDKPIFLSGTPVTKHAGEIWSTVVATEPHRIDNMDYDTFTRRFCTFKLLRIPNRPAVETISGTKKSMIPELRQRLDGWWKFVKLRDVMPDLPRASRRVVPLSVRKMAPDVARFEETKEGRALLEAFRSGEFARSDELHLARIQRLLSEAKAKASADYVLELFEDGLDSALVWAKHIETLDMLERHFRHADMPPLRIDGSTSARERGRIQTAFQRPDGPRVILLQSAAAREAVTLTRSRYACFVEADWVPGHNQQCEFRITRIGQTRPCQIDYLAVAGSVDMAVQEINARRVEEIDEIESA